MRALTAAGDIEQLERVTDDREAAERHELRRRAAMEGFESLWRSGDRLAALDALRAWARAHGDDHEARRLLDERGARVLTAGRCALTTEGERVVVVGRFPAVVGREGDVAVRGASVSGGTARSRARETSSCSATRAAAGGRRSTACPWRARSRCARGSGCRSAPTSPSRWRATTARSPSASSTGWTAGAASSLLRRRAPHAARRAALRAARRGVRARRARAPRRAGVALPFVLAAGDRLESGAVTVTVDDGAA
ncbi:MAG: hypothetical protein R3A52_04955 [Polyangiales bacterium]